MNKPVLITKMLTTNLGNAALSSEFVSLAARADPTVLGRPFGLERYTLDRLRACEDPLATFRRWSDGLVALSRVVPGRDTGRSHSFPAVQVLGESHMATGASRKLAKGMRDTMLSAVPFAPRYARRVRILRTASRILYSGAGEVGNYTAFLRQALELNAWLTLGVPGYAVNQSVVVTDPALAGVLRHVYSRLDGLIVRGERSRRLLVDLGIEPKRIDVAPDTAWLAPRQVSSRRPTGRVGITINGEDPRTREWGAVVEHLKRLGKSVVFLTSDAGYDLRVGRELALTHGIRVTPPTTSYQEYSASLADLDFVVTERLHTAELAFVQRVPVIAVERGRHKTIEVFEMLGYPVPVIRREGQWTNDVIEAADFTLRNRGELQSFLESEVPRMVEQAQLNARPAFAEP